MCGPTMHQAGYHHANMLAQQLRNDITNQQTEMLAMVQSLILVPDQTEYQTKLSMQPAENAVINTVHQQMIEILQAMQATQIANNANSGGSNGVNNGGNNTNGGGNNGENNGDNNGDNNIPCCRHNRITPDDASFNCQDKSNYCHMHRASNHNSGDCNRQAPGHKNTATFTNRMGGLNAFCLPVNAE